VRGDALRPSPSLPMPDDTTTQHRMSAEGADPLLFAGVNDANLQELQRTLGVRISFRGDAVTVTGTGEQVERALPIVQGLLDLARMGESVTPDDVYRLAADTPTAEMPAAGADGKIVLPGLRRAIAPKTQGQREYLQAITNNEIVVGIGPAGTGKTYLAVAKAVEALARKRVRRIILARPAVEAGESLGFLPGDLQAKVDPYLRPLYDALEDMMPHDRVQRALETRTIEIAPLAYMRGRTLADAFIILDEAQNATGAQMKMFLTRLGVNSRTVVTGDKTQIDLPRREESGLVQIERLLPGVEGIAFCYLHETDVVRHRLVREIIRAYAEDQNG
jgi:phosphate starvation-inducible protein PhoH and related proteins